MIVAEGVCVFPPVCVVVFVLVWVRVEVIVTLEVPVPSAVPDTEGEDEGLLVLELLGVKDAVTVGLAVIEADPVLVKELVWLAVVV